MDLALVSVDSTAAGAHHDMAGAHLDTEDGPDREERRRVRRRHGLWLTATLLGRPRGGPTSKVRIAADRRIR